MNSAKRTALSLTILVALVAAPALSTAAESDACLRRAQCEPFTFYLDNGGLSPAEPESPTPQGAVLLAGSERGARFTTGVLERDLVLDPEGVLAFRLHRDAVAPVPGTAYGTIVSILRVDAETRSESVMLEHTVWGAPDVYPDAASNARTGAGPAAAGYEAFAIPVAALHGGTLDAGARYVLTFRLVTSHPTVQATALDAVADASCFAGGAVKSVYAPAHACPIAASNLPLVDDVLYFGGRDHASHVTLPVLVTHTP